MLCVVTGTWYSRFAKPYPFATTSLTILTTATAIPGIFCDISRDKSIYLHFDDRIVGSVALAQAYVPNPLALLRVHCKRASDRRSHARAS